MGQRILFQQTAPEIVGQCQHVSRFTIEVEGTLAPMVKALFLPLVFKNDTEGWSTLLIHPGFRSTLFPKTVVAESRNSLFEGQPPSNNVYLGQVAD